tara:strand:+ start:429 stop:848 length:420 start_codon:yes stop_codon:yes gene_type:complete
MNTKTEIVKVHGIVAADIEGLDKNAAAKFLMIDKGLELNQINKVWSTFGSKSVKGGIAQGIADFLVIQPRTEKELAEYLLDQTHSSPNAVRWFSMHNASRLLANEIFAQFGKKVDAEAKTVAQEARMAALVATVTKAKK